MTESTLARVRMCLVGCDVSSLHHIQAQTPNSLPMKQASKIDAQASCPPATQSQHIRSLNEQKSRYHNQPLTPPVCIPLISPMRETEGPGAIPDPVSVPALGLCSYSNRWGNIQLVVATTTFTFTTPSVDCISAPISHHTDRARRLLCGRRRRLLDSMAVGDMEIPALVGT